mmetsp:Transcript_28461/g.64432  ORF Transcript_28461/g.64432 Transcript_28461/m.64432 type:complete len:262 (-) Transcript_28461:155-940(-)
MSAVSLSLAEVPRGAPERSARSSRAARSPRPESPEELSQSHEQPSHHQSQTFSQNGVLRKKLYDQNLADWSARYRKNKQSLENLSKDCELLRSDVAKQQQEYDERVESCRQLEDKFANEVLVRYNEAKENFEAASQQKGALQVQLSEHRKTKAQLLRDKKFLIADFERKHAELMRTAEARDKLDSQLAQLTQQLGQLNTDRRRMERELDQVQHNLRQNTELADEVNSEFQHIFTGVKDSMDLHMSPGGESQSPVQHYDESR